MAIDKDKHRFGHVLVLSKIMFQKKERKKEMGQDRNQTKNEKELYKENNSKVQK